MQGGLDVQARVIMSSCSLFGYTTQLSTVTLLDLDLAQHSAALTLIFTQTHGKLGRQSALKNGGTDYLI